jgi:flagellar hook-associated protein 2
MPNITSMGIGSGLDVSSMISALMSIERQPLAQLETRNKELNTELSAIGKLRSFASAMRDSASKLSSVTLWNATTATSADETSVKVSAESGAAAGDYSIKVDKLATRQTLASSAFASAAAVVGEGALTIELVSWTGEPAPTGFTAKAGATPVTVTIGAGASSLEKIRDAINGAEAGVTASIVNDASGARLSLRSKDTGAENGFRITASETADDGNAATGLSAFAYDAVAASPMARAETAVDAVATINGIGVTSASNTLQDVADGLTLTLLKTTTAEVGVTVGTDDAAVTEAMDKFVVSFNDLAKYIREQTKYDAATKTAGTLQGDRTALGLQSQLRGVINQSSSAAAAFSTLSDVGLSIQADGTLALNKTKFGSALGNRAELKKLLAADGADGASSGFMDRFRDLGNQLLDTDGSFDSRTKSLEAIIQRNEKSQDALEVRLASKQARLEKQYQALDESMAKLNGMSSYVSAQLAALARGS